MLMVTISSRRAVPGTLRREPAAAGSGATVRGSRRVAIGAGNLRAYVQGQEDAEHAALSN